MIRYFSAAIIASIVLVSGCSSGGKDEVDYGTTKNALNGGANNNAGDPGNSPSGTSCVSISAGFCTDTIVNEMSAKCTGSGGTVVSVNVDTCAVECCGLPAPSPSKEPPKKDPPPNDPPSNDPPPPPKE
jgi:hypothetical protein